MRKGHGGGWPGGEEEKDEEVDEKEMKGAEVELIILVGSQFSFLRRSMIRPSDESLIEHAAQARSLASRAASPRGGLWPAFPVGICPINPWNPGSDCLVSICSTKNLAVTAPPCPQDHTGANACPPRIPRA